MYWLHRLGQDCLPVYILLECEWLRYRGCFHCGTTPQKCVTWWETLSLCHTSDKLLPLSSVKGLCLSFGLLLEIVGNSQAIKNSTYKEDPESFLFCLCPCLPYNVGQTFVSSLKEYFSSKKEAKVLTLGLWGFGDFCLFWLVGFFKHCSTESLK